MENSIFPTHLILKMGLGNLHWNWQHIILTMMLTHLESECSQGVEGQYILSHQSHINVTVIAHSLEFNHFNLYLWRKKLSSTPSSYSLSMCWIHRNCSKISHGLLQLWIVRAISRLIFEMSNKDLVLLTLPVLLKDLKTNPHSQIYFVHKGYHIWS